MKHTPLRSKKTWFFIVSAIVGLFLLVYPIPYFIEGPGSTEDVDPMIEIDALTNDPRGTYMLTTISIQQATPLTYLKGALPFYEIVSEEELLGNMGSKGEYNTLQTYFMKSSIDSALKAAFDASSLPANLEYKGVYVLSVQTTSDFYGKLQPGDVIVGVDGNTFKNSAAFTDYVQAKKSGDTLSVTRKRDGQEKTISGVLMVLPETGNAGIGISLVDQTDLQTTPRASIQVGNIGGPSAGLMFALRTYTLLNDVVLPRDYQIAGTGTIDPAGNVGRIGGIDKKVFAASKKGVDIFFAPDDEVTKDMQEAYPDIQSNYEEALEAAKRLNTKMKIIPIKHLEEAIAYVETLS